jgi:hypothetical protein
MSLKLTFSKVSILSVSRKPESGTVKLSCAPSKQVLKRMGWADFPEAYKTGQPEGKLAATICEFTPSDSTQSKFAFELITLAVRDFEFVRTQIKKGKSANKAPSYRLELHCAVDFNDQAGAGKVEKYMSTVMESSMTVTYDPEAVQEDLPLSDDSQAELDGARRKPTAKEED